MPPPASPTVRRRRLAAELRRLRETHDLTLDDVAERLHWSASKLSRIENAKTGAKPTDVRRLLDLYGQSGNTVDELITLAREAERKGWWEAYSDALSDEYSAYIGLEAEAVSAALWQTKMIPGLLQTEDYARQTLLALQSLVGIPPGRIMARLKARQLRQEVLTRERPLVFTAILDESTLRRGFGGPEVMHPQLMHLVSLTSLPNVTVRVRPFDSPGLPPGIDSFHLLHFGPTFHDVVYIELLSSGIYVEEDLDTYHYRQAFDTLAAQSLDEAESAQFIRRVADSMWR